MGFAMIHYHFLGSINANIFSVLSRRFVAHYSLHYIKLSRFLCGERTSTSSAISGQEQTCFQQVILIAGVRASLLMISPSLGIFLEVGWRNRRSIRIQPFSVVVVVVAVFHTN
jgi:hypothetical protein